MGVVSLVVAAFCWYVSVYMGHEFGQKFDSSHLYVRVRFHGMSSQCPVLENRIFLQCKVREIPKYW